MKEQVKFFRCNICGNLVATINSSGVPMVCCDEEMEELQANTVDASTEKHVPVVTNVSEGVWNVKIGSVPHPMTPEHFIDFVYFETSNGGQLVYLNGEPSAQVCTLGEKLTAVYAYCNLHGLWKTEIK
ncbi:MAG: desulfoferrodoxin [Bacteroidia bacterium]|nr:desulfoferrodoxin [Bacteroidia bacterium]